jgi:hypothetical protein
MRHYLSAALIVLAIPAIIVAIGSALVPVRRVPAPTVQPQRQVRTSGPVPSGRIRILNPDHNEAQPYNIKWKTPLIRNTPAEQNQIISDSLIDVDPSEVYWSNGRYHWRNP